MKVEPSCPISSAEFTFTLAEKSPFETVRATLVSFLIGIVMEFETKYPKNIVMKSANKVALIIIKVTFFSIESMSSRLRLSYKIYLILPSSFLLAKAMFLILYRSVSLSIKISFSTTFSLAKSSNMPSFNTEKAF